MCVPPFSPGLSSSRRVFSRRDGRYVNSDPHAVAVDLPAAVVVDVFVVLCSSVFEVRVFHIGISFHDRALRHRRLSEAGGGVRVVWEQTSRVPKVEGPEGRW